MSMAEGGYGEPPAWGPSPPERELQPPPPKPGEPSALDAAVARAIAGDGGAFDEIYRALSGPVFSYLTSQVRRREDAEDLTGQVFLEAMRGIRTFSGDGSAFRGWLFRIAHNRAVDLARRLARRPEAALEEAELLPDALATEDRAIIAVSYARVWRAVRALPEQQRRVIVLRLGAGLTAREIADALGKRIGTVKALQHRALVTLSKVLKDLEGSTGDGPTTL
jgi:RNA polymerase sigma-70 factor (ECF subfamily)